MGYSAALAVMGLVLVSSPLGAKERRRDIFVRAGPLGQTAMVLGRQTRTSIRIADPALLSVMVREVRGRFTALEALTHLLRGTSAYARALSPTAFAIEHREMPSRRTLARAKAAAVQPREIVVTGAKRDLPLSAYAGSVALIDGTAFSDADGALGTGAIVSRTSALSSTHLGPGREKLFVRGIADSSFVGLAQSTVGQYWGDSRINYSAQDPNLRLYDIERVEILEGPQATLYGAGALGGLLRVIPRSVDLRKTTARIWAGASAVWHGGLSRDGGVIFNLPLVAETLGLRLVAYDAHDAGYIDDLSRGQRDINSVRTFGWRGSLSARISDRLRLEIRSLRQVINGQDCQYVDLGSDGLDQMSVFAQPFRSAFQLTDATVRADLGHLDFTSVLAVARHDVAERFVGVSGVRSDDPSGPVPHFTPEVRTRRARGRTVTLETRLARAGLDETGWLAGFAAMRNDASSERGRREDGPLASSIRLRTRTDELALFGEASLKLLRKFLLTGGGRYSWFSVADRSQTIGSVATGAISAKRRPIDRQRFGRFYPSLGLALRTDRDTTVFARYQEGFRPGGATEAGGEVQSFAGDRMTTVEFGLRHAGRLGGINASLSWSRWHGIQADIVNPTGFTSTRNVGDAEILSASLSGYWKPFSALTLDGAVDLNDSRMVSLLPASAGTQGQAGQMHLPNIADVTGRVGMNYRRFVGAAEMTLEGHARYVGRSYLGVGPILGLPQGRYVETGLQIRFGMGAHGFSLALDNLLDSKGNRFALGSPFLLVTRPAQTPLQPRTLRFGYEMTM
ncbi:TonB-dependent receptor [Novosphingobium sp. JCM 18896]|uniref:TonB-dependent receptor n=1 Tax=Novosphingobium sp. JCM 18896 TaxID=2989731 RepID=UPI002221AEF7|nr:TonB-dependent receptor [Novosphingobium sp. JCM 18896]MCW1430808.1 TonB-dependent receptor [Novosphingobium sp. JCM 18896]